MFFRVYFNRKREAPQIWSIDEGTQATEVNVINFQLLPGCTAKGFYTAEPVNDNSPSAYMIVEADYYNVHQGIAYFFKESQQLP